MEEQYNGPYKERLDEINGLKELKRQCHIVQFMKKRQLNNEITQYQIEQNELSHKTR